MNKKIAIAADGDVISQHFGHCEGFFIYDIADGNVAQRSFLANPGHKPGLLPRLLHEARVQVVIAGGMGQGAIDLFNEAQIDVITGAAGTVEQTLQSFLAGTLVSDDSPCREHQHAGDCGEHEN